MYYSVTFDTTTGICYGGNSYVEKPATLPSNQVPCTQAQAQNPGAWVVVSGSLVQSLPSAQATQSALIKKGFANAVAAIPFTINGVNYTLDAAQTKQAADMAIVVAANNALNYPVAWAASTSVAQYAIQLVGSSYLFCTVAGTTGTTAPTPPTTFGTPVTDGTVTWELYGRTLELSDGSHATFTVQELVSIFQQVEVYIHYQKNQKLSLLAQIQAATTVSAVQAIVW